jgi:hypothetical protein
MKLFGKFPESFPNSLVRGLALFAAALFVVGACVEFSTNSSFAQTTPTRQATPATPSAPQAGRGPRYVEPDPINFDDHTGWQSLFDGVSLKSWDGPTDVWKVTDGAIVATSTAANPSGSTYMIWTGGEPANFEFKTELKVEGIGSNSGIQFRATRLGPLPDKKYSQWDTRGYQADWDMQNANTGALIECCAGSSRGVPIRTDRAFRGQIVRTGTTLDQKPSLLGTLGDPAELTKYIKAEDWNQIHLIARGNTMIYIINGHLMSVFLDDNATLALSHGVIALQLEGRGDIKAYFRNIWLKNLP